jgi:UDP-glucose 4-epimerase
VQDVVDAVGAALRAPKSGWRAYNVTGGSRVFLQDVASIVAHLFPGARIDLDPGPDPMDVVQGEFDISAAARELVWRPQVSLPDGIRSYATWLAERRKSDAPNLHFR